MDRLARFFINSPLGWLEIGLRGERLFFVSKARRGASFQKKDLSILFYQGQNKGLKKAPQASFPPLAEEARRQIESYFKGRLKSFDIPLADRGSDFQKKVWRAMKKIPYGKTQTYSQIAARAKSPKAFRAVGHCCAKNPFLLVVPCHRVLSQKGLGGFALGLKAKKYLLSLEAGQSS